MRQILQQDLPLLEALKGLSPDSSNRTIRSWVEKGRVTINGRTVESHREIVREGEELLVGPRTVIIDEEIKILYEDRDLVVIEKPEGLLSVATAFEDQLTAHAILKERSRGKTVTPVHRLDRETSGVMVFAYSDAAKLGLKEQFFHHTIEREYLAIIEGALESGEGTWQAYLKEDANYYVRAVPAGAGGALSTTHYFVQSSKGKYAFLRLRLETGRKNQIRVHCQNAGHPIVGDQKYGSQSNPIRRLCLHAAKLGFQHPVTQKRLSFESLPPKEFSRLI